MKYGLIGEHLPHSFSKTVHEKIADYEYDLCELSPSQLADFMTERNFRAINVTIPYKQAVIPYLSEITQRAEAIGAVNCIVNRNGKLYGDNTDFGGMKALIEREGIEISGKKVLITGTGGTSRTAEAVARCLGAAEIIKVSRRGGEKAVTYEEACRNHRDADIIINTTPCGMYPEADACPLDIDCFPELSGLIDVIYNPLKTLLVQKAQSRGIKASGGLYMLVAQAVIAAENFLDRKFEEGTIERIYNEVYQSKRNIVLVGMSQSGKSTVGQRLSDLLKMDLIDSDRVIADRTATSIPDIFAGKGEEYFRNIESQVIKDLSSENGLIIATGGGSVLREKNLEYLRTNGILFFLDRPLDQLTPTADRPLANEKEKLIKLFESRYQIYRDCCDVRIINDVSPEDAASKIVNQLNKTGERFR